MLKDLKTILEIQELDMQMIQLMGLKNQRLDEMRNLNSVKADLARQAEIKTNEIVELKKSIRLVEGDINEIQAKFKKLESQQSSIKKVEEFNALSHEMSQVDRERVAKEQRLSDLQEKLAAEEEVLYTINQTAESTAENGKVLESEMTENIKQINNEGRVLKEQRDGIVTQAEPEVFAIYERLLKNKKDRVVVPIENRCCSGCHIMLTAQDENLVRKGERIVFCEHCARIHYWPESQELEGIASTTKTRRRRTTTKV